MSRTRQRQGIERGRRFDNSAEQGEYNNQQSTITNTWWEYTGATRENPIRLARFTKIIDFRFQIIDHQAMLGRSVEAEA